MSAVIEAAFAAQRPLRSFGATLTAVSPGVVEITLPINEATTFAGGSVMAGVIGMAADVAAGLSIVSALDPPRPITTIEMKLNVLVAAVGETLICRGRVERIGRQIAVATAEAFAVKDGAEKKCAILSATFVVSG